MILAMGVSTGIGISKAMVFRKNMEQPPCYNPHSINDELKKVDFCIRETTEELKDIYSSLSWNKNDPAVGVLDKYIKIINNPSLIYDIKERISIDSVTAEYAIGSIMEDFKRVVGNLDDEYLYDRSSDIDEIKNRLLEKLTGISMLNLKRIDEECIVVAEDLTPGDVLSMNPDYIKGIVTILGGPSSSCVVMARHMNIPAVTGVGYEGRYIKNGDLLIVDGSRGKVIVNPDDSEIEAYMGYSV